MATDGYQITDFDGDTIKSYLNKLKTFFSGGSITGGNVVANGEVTANGHRLTEKATVAQVNTAVAAVREKTDKLSFDGEQLQIPGIRTMSDGEELGHLDTNENRNVELYGNNGVHIHSVGDVSEECKSHHTTADDNVNITANGDINVSGGQVTLATTAEESAVLLLTSKDDIRLSAEKEMYLKATDGIKATVEGTSDVVLTNEASGTVVRSKTINLNSVNYTKMKAGDTDAAPSVTVDATNSRNRVNLVGTEVRWVKKVSNGNGSYTDEEVLLSNWKAKLDSIEIGSDGKLHLSVGGKVYTFVPDNVQYEVSEDEVKDDVSEDETKDDVITEEQNNDISSAYDNNN